MKNMNKENKNTLITVNKWRRNITDIGRIKT